MLLTAQLRWQTRTAVSSDSLRSEMVVVLQQFYDDDLLGGGEWRDVPITAEAVVDDRM